MSELRCFKEWYQVYQEATPPPPVVQQKYQPRNIFGRLYDTLTGTKRMSPAEVQAANAEAEKQQRYGWQADLRTQQAATASGNPDDPAVRAGKSETLAQIFYEALMHSLGAVPANADVPDALKKMATEMARMFTGAPATGTNIATGVGGATLTNRGIPISPEPIIDVMTLVHRDPNVSPQAKQGNWEDPFEVFRGVLLPAFKGSPQTWYNPNAVKEVDKRPPGSVVDADGFDRAVYNWGKQGQGNKTINATDIENELTTKIGKFKGKLDATDVEEYIKDIIGDLKSKGNVINVGKYDIESLVKNYAAAPTAQTEEKVSDWLSYHDRNYPINNHDDLMNAIEEIKEYIIRRGNKPIEDTKGILAWVKAHPRP